mgnify:CR=1 FL=1
MPRWSQRSHTDQVCTPNKRVKHDGTKLEEIIALTTVDGERQVKARWEGGSISWYPLAAIVAPHDIFFDSLTEQINKFNKKLAKKDKTIKELNKKITEYEKNNTIVVPSNCVQVTENEAFVMVAKEIEGKVVAQKQIVKLGLANKNSTEVTEGLEIGENLIINGFQELAEGQVLTIKKATDNG